VNVAHLPEEHLLRLMVVLEVGERAIVSMRGGLDERGMPDESGPRGDRLRLEGGGPLIVAWLGRGLVRWLRPDLKRGRVGQAKVDVRNDPVMAAIVEGVADRERVAAEVQHPRLGARRHQVEDVAVLGSREHLGTFTQNEGG
jgi:hypothetical protein